MKSNIFKFGCRLLWGRLTGKAYPFLVQFSVTNRCNSRCKYCYATYYTRPSEEMPIKQVKAIIDDLVRAGMFRLNIVGGEPLVRRIINMVLGLKAKALQCNLAIPYPGSQLYDEYIKRYHISRNWSLYDPAGNQPPYPTKLNLVRVRQNVYLRFYLRNPAYLWSTRKNTDARSIFTFLRNSLSVLWGRKML